MLEVFKQQYFMLFYLIALILALKRYNLYYDTHLKFLPILITYTLSSEVLGYIIRNVEDVQIIYEEKYTYYNTAIFNIFDIVFFLYFLFVFKNSINEVKSKKIINFGIVLFILTSFINLFIQDFRTEPQSFAIIIGCITLIYASFTYIIKLFKKNQLIPPYRNLLFWISIGLIIFYSLYPISMYLVSYKYDLFKTYNLSSYHHITIATMYGFFIIGFIVMKRTIKKI